ncbi:MAG: NAD-dependent isocitrate dehydrogenase [Bryobacterales bacterium]|nr:NAD-dependent isocitrate dehydrogenase [Bryobacterales bacterium]
MQYNVTLIAGDGIGPEVAEAAVRVMEATKVPIVWDKVELSSAVIEREKKALPDAVVESLLRTRLGLKGPVSTPIAGGYPSVNVALRKRFDLFANFRPVVTIPGVHSRFDDLSLNIAIFRENTEDLYSGLEQEIVPGVVTGIKVITRKASERIARKAFEFALREGRKKVTAIHKANIMKQADGLFLTCCREVAKEFPAITYNELIVDNASMQLVMNPSQFDVMILPNLYGDIISDICAGLVGGLGIVPGANFGENFAIFESVHGSAPDIAGKGIANPTAILQCCVLLLNHIGEREASRRLQKAIFATYKDGRHLTGDVGGTAGTAEFTDAVIAAL